MRKLKLILGNEMSMTRLVDTETGDDIEGVIGVHVDMEPSNKFRPIATITLAILDIEAPVPTSQHTEEQG